MPDLPLVSDVKQSTLVDMVEDSIIEYIRQNNLAFGDSLPNEIELAKSLGVARSVLREALSRLKMLGLIESRSRRGMILKEPSMFEPIKKVIKMNLMGHQTIVDLLNLRIALELGMVDDVFRNLSDRNIEDLVRIVNVEAILTDNEYEHQSEYNFHVKLYQITGNQSILLFQDIIHPVIEFAKKKFEHSFRPINKKLKENGLVVTHADLLEFIKKRDREGFKRALGNHFLPYRIFMKEV